MSPQSYALFLWLRRERILYLCMLIFSIGTFICLIGIPLFIILIVRFSVIPKACYDLKRACRYYGVPGEVRDYFSRYRFEIRRYADSIRDSFLSDMLVIRKQSHRKLIRRMSDSEWLHYYKELHRSVGIGILRTGNGNNIKQEMAGNDMEAAVIKLKQEEAWQRQQALQRQMDDQQRQLQEEEQRMMEERQRNIQEQQRNMQEQQDLNEQMIQQMNNLF